MMTFPIVPIDPANANDNITIKPPIAFLSYLSFSKNLPLTIDLRLIYLILES